MVKVQPEQETKAQSQTTNALHLIFSGQADMLLNYDRKDGVPEILQKQGVSAELWSQTYSVVSTHSIWDAQIQRNQKNIWKYPIVKTNEANLMKAWCSLLPKLQAKYGPLGIHVTLAHDRKDPKRTVGLSFEVWKSAAAIKDQKRLRQSECKVEGQRSKLVPLSEQMPPGVAV